MTDWNPQAEQMADESMVRTLDAQARAIWPQEVELVRRHGLSGELRILDAGCGTGEGTARFAELFPRASVLGIDVLEQSLVRARQRCTALGERVRFEHRSIFETGLPDRSFDLVVCRHVIHSIPHAERALAELVRVTRPGGRLHLIPEDYGMLHFERGSPDPLDFWHEVPVQFGAGTGTDLFAGRHAFRMLSALGLTAIAVDYVVVDTLRVPRETFASILVAWRDGYVDVLARHTRFTPAEVTSYFDRMIDSIQDPLAYAAWMVPVVTAVVP